METFNISRVNQSKINSVDFNNLGFGTYVTDHMFLAEYKNEKWQTPEIIPFQTLHLSPTARVYRPDNHPCPV